MVPERSGSRMEKSSSISAGFAWSPMSGIAFRNSSREITPSPSSSHCLKTSITRVPISVSASRIRVMMALPSNLASSSSESSWTSTGADAWKARASAASTFERGPVLARFGGFEPAFSTCNFTPTWCCESCTLYVRNTFSSSLSSIVPPLSLSKLPKRREAALSFTWSPKSGSARLNSEKFTRPSPSSSHSRNRSMMRLEFLASASCSRCCSIWSADCSCSTALGPVDATGFVGALPSPADSAGASSAAAAPAADAFAKLSTTLGFFAGFFLRLLLSSL